jgi:hypothetical protein
MTLLFGENLAAHSAPSGGYGRAAQSLPDDNPLQIDTSYPLHIKGNMF